MVNFSKRRGYYDWVVQRVSAVYLLFYFAPLLVLIFFSGMDSYFFWKQLFGHVWMKLLSIIAVLFISAHAWIGLWTVFTDYIKNQKARLIVQGVVIFLLIFYVGWGVYAIWMI